MRIGAAYIRVSTDDQLDISPESQLDEIQRYAKSHDILIPEEYIFMERTGRSGKRADNRPEFQRMIATAKEKPQPFEVILVWKFSRFARNQDESTFYKGMLRKKLKIDIESVSEPIMEGMYGRLIEMIIEWQDEFYSYNLGVEVKRGMAKKAELKGYQLVPPLGYAAVGNGKPYVIREDEYKIVEMIFHMYAVDRLDMTAIARQLNASGYLTRRGNPFEKRSIDRIIQNRFYVGTVEWNGFSFEGTHKTRASVTELFEQCQERRKAEFRPMRHRNVSTCKHWLSGLMRCSVCGATLSYTGSGAVPYFTCWKYSKGLHPESCSISVKKMERIVLRSWMASWKADILSIHLLPAYPVPPQIHPTKSSPYIPSSTGSGTRKNVPGLPTKTKFTLWTNTKKAKPACDQRFSGCPMSCSVSLNSPPNLRRRKRSFLTASETSAISWHLLLWASKPKGTRCGAS